MVNFFTYLGFFRNVSIASMIKARKKYLFDDYTLFTRLPQIIASLNQSFTRRDRDWEQVRINVIPNLKKLDFRGFYW